MTGKARKEKMKMSGEIGDIVVSGANDRPDSFSVSLTTVSYIDQPKRLVRLKLWQT